MVKHRKKTMQNAMQNYTYKMLNGKNDHFFKFYLKQHRNIRMIADNKVGHHDVSMGHSNFTQMSYLYRALNVYNKLPRYLTLIKQEHLFKKWCKIYNLDNKIKLKHQIDHFEDEDNIEDDENVTDRDLQCHYDDEEDDQG